MGQGAHCTHATSLAVSRTIVCFTPGSRCAPLPPAAGSMRVTASEPC
jgi:hypothetical protein